MERSFRFGGRLAAGLVLLPFLAGCGVEPGFVAREWSKTIRHYNMMPVFAPREDVQIGDIFLLPGTPADLDRQVMEGKSFLSMSVLADSVDLAPHLHAFQKTRFQFPRIDGPSGYVGDGGTAGNGGAVKVPATCGEERAPCDLFGTPPTAIRSLRQVALPDVVVASFTGAEARALLPAAAFAAAGGAAYQNVESVSLKIAAAESYALPAMSVVNALFPALDDAFTVACFDLRGTRTLIAGGWPADRPIYLRIPTEMYLARAIDLEVKLSRSAGAGVEVAMPLPDGRARQAMDALLARLSGLPPVKTDSAGGGAGTGTDDAPAAGDPASAPAPATPAPTPDIPADLAVWAAYIRGMLDTTSAHGPGGDLRIIHSSIGAATLRRVFERPLAIGFRGIDVAVTGDIASKDDLRTVESEFAAAKCAAAATGAKQLWPRESISVVSFGAVAIAPTLHSDTQAP